MSYIHFITTGCGPKPKVRNCIMNFQDLSIKELANIFNQAIETNNLDIAPVKKFASKGDAIKRIEKVFAVHNLQYTAHENTADDQAPAAKLVKEKKAKKVKAEKAPAGKRGPAPEYSDDMVITNVVANPKREGSAAHGRFAKYKNGMTIAEAVKAGLRRDDFRWDVAHKHITIK
jgi:hypothetical protein